MNYRMLMLGALIVVSCKSLGGRTGKVDQFIGPADASKVKRIALIAGGSGRSDMQVLSRARERLTKAGVTIIRRPGAWESNEMALKDICVQRGNAPENVDGVAFVAWDRLTLYSCDGLAVATDISGKYAGIDVMVDHLVRYLGVTPPEQK